MYIYICIFVLIYIIKHATLYQNKGVIPTKSDVSPEPALISLVDNCQSNSNNDKILKKNEKNENEKNLISQLENMKFASQPNFDLD
jgi:hypothetical protein